MDELVSHGEVCAAWANWVIYKQSTLKNHDADLDGFMRFTGWHPISASRTTRVDLGIYLSPEQANRVRWLGSTHGVTLLKAYAAKYAKEVT